MPFQGETAICGQKSEDILKKRTKWFRTLVRQRFFIILLLFLQLAFLIFFLVSQSRVSVVIKWLLHIISFYHFGFPRFRRTFISAFPLSNPI